MGKGVEEEAPVGFREKVADEGGDGEGVDGVVGGEQGDERRAGVVRSGFGEEDGEGEERGVVDGSVAT